MRITNLTALDIRFPTSRSLENRILEYVDHLHEHFLDPVLIRNGHYMPPRASGYSIRMRAESLRDYAYPASRAWAGAA